LPSCSEWLRQFWSEFNRLYPSDRADYVEIKRNLLREAIFLRKVHERMARLILRQSSVEEILEQVCRPNAPKKH